MWAAGKREQIFSHCSLPNLDDFRLILCYFENFIFLAITRQRNSLFGSNAVHPLKCLCPISVLRIEQRESITIEIGRPIIDDVRLLMPHPNHFLTRGVLTELCMCRCCGSNKQEVTVTKECSTQCLAATLAPWIHDTLCPLCLHVRAICTLLLCFSQSL